MPYVKDRNGTWWYSDARRRVKATAFRCSECGAEFHRLRALVRNPSAAFCSRRCSNARTARLHRSTRAGAGNPAWKGGRKTDANGYVWIYRPEHPAAQNNCVREHRLVMEGKLGRLLRSEETVHHRNGVHGDNRRRNLELWSGSHPPTQRVRDLLTWAREILKTYGREQTA